MPRIFIWIGGAFLAVGLVFAAVGLWAWTEDRALSNGGARTTGTVMELERRYDSDNGSTFRPVVVFHDREGTRHQFVGNVGSSPPAYAPGETVSVIYDPAAPGRAIIDGFMDRHFVPLIFGGIGSVFAMLGSAFLFLSIRRRRIVARLKATGIPIKARFVECYRDTSTKVNGRSPWRVVGQAKHPATGKLCSFKSDQIWVDLSRHLAGRDLRVLVDPARPDQHFVDLSEYLDES
ncbi:DUF3592 domain-containing protein [Pelagerythrobacter marensis]|uniref:DUF3592 domain-containing protein n=1 Tax=Pelagerythrobacter marensis TaxID=543877 RepID=A0A0G3XA82_9SPHN|nr:DUF3592 domain-containing protein [Pelagerythrobacter marensis]AKM08082.1 hypothetical protein AM2010_2020 [Pelagerythrobacter marensis]